jgi:hypothetical protein
LIRIIFWKELWSFSSQAEAVGWTAGDAANGVPVDRSQAKRSAPATMSLHSFIALMPVSANALSWLVVAASPLLTGSSQTESRPLGGARRDGERYEKTL